MSGHLDATTYRNIMYKLPWGYALYDPGPVDYDHIRVGDVGYVHHGSFRRLFNACFEKTDQANKGCPLPESFTPLAPQFRKVHQSGFLDKGIRVSKSIRDTSVGAGVIVPGGVYVQQCPRPTA